LAAGFGAVFGVVERARLGALSAPNSRKRAARVLCWSVSNGGKSSDSVCQAHLAPVARF